MVKTWLDIIRLLEKTYLIAGNFIAQQVNMVRSYLT